MRTGENGRMGSKRGLLAAVAIAAATPLAAHAAELGMLDSLLKGAWNLQIRDDGSQRRICVRDGREFIQLRHTQPGCSRFVVEDTPSQVVVQYTCRGNGYGRTTIRREANNLLQIRSQGIIDGAPFSFNGEARHSSGSC